MIQVIKSQTVTKAEDMPYDGFYKYDSDVAEGYDQSRENERHWARENAFVKKLMEKTDAANLLDLPVGTGRFIQYYGRLNEIYGVDISDFMLSQARGKLEKIKDADRVHLENGDVFKLRFDNEHFDLAVVFRLLHLIPDHDLGKAIGELCRVTRKQIVLQTYTPSNKGNNRPLAMFANKLKKILNMLRGETKAFEEPIKPWSHIQSYNHSKSFIDGLFSENGFNQEFSEVIDVYGDLDVNATVYARGN